MFVPAPVSSMNITAFPFTSAFIIMATERSLLRPTESMWNGMILWRAVIVVAHKQVKNIIIYRFIIFLLHSFSHE
jgi:hypothetical protein